jgi:hypothetical protein
MNIPIHKLVSITTDDAPSMTSVWPARTNSLWAIHLISKKMMSMLLTSLHFASLHFSLSFDLPFKHPYTAPAFFPELLSNHWQVLSRIVSETYTKYEYYGEIASGQIHGSKQKNVKIITSTQLRDIFYTDSHDIQVLSSTVASRYYNCFTDGRTSPRNYG